VAKGKQSKAVAVTEAMTPEEFRAAMSGDREAKVEAAAKLHALTQAADAGDAAALKEVVAIYRDLPTLWPKDNLLDANIERVLMKRLALPENLLIKKVIEHQITEMRTALLGTDPSPLERLLVERLVLDWVAVHQADLVLYQHEGSTQRAEYLLTRADRAEQRMMRAAKALATVRRLMGPSVQLNIAEEIKQVNLGR